MEQLNSYYVMNVHVLYVSPSPSSQPVWWLAGRDEGAVNLAGIVGGHRGGEYSISKTPE